MAAVAMVKKACIHEAGVGRGGLIPSLSPWAIERVMVSLTEAEIQGRARGWRSAWRERLERRS